LLGLSRRHDVTLVTQAGGDPADPDAIAAWRAAGVDVHVSWWPRPRGFRLLARRARLAWSWLTGGEPWRNVLYRDADVQRTIERLLRSGSHDVVVVDDNLMAGYRFATRMPMILTEHEVRRPRRVHWLGLLRSGSARHILRELDWQRWLPYQRKSWRPFGRIQCVTPDDAAVASRILPDAADRIRVNPFGIELPQPLDEELEEPDVIVFVGAMQHGPNVDAALWLAAEIMPLLRLRRPGVRLYIVGHSVPPSIEALRSADIVVTGAVPLVEPFLARAAVVVAPVRIGGGLRTKVLQAMAFGKPVVTTERGARGIGVAGEELPLVIADDPVAFSDRCAELLADADRRHDLGRRARQYVATHHSPAAYVERLEELFAEVLPASAPSSD
jgi:glycosyltransferase involved in cell wall biosynthesis